MRRHRKERSLAGQHLQAVSRQWRSQASMTPMKASEIVPGLDWTEGQFQAWVVELAKDHGWRVHITLKRMRKASIVADPDWPDLEMVLGGRLIYAELKSQTGKLSDGQRETLQLLAEANDEVYIWTPGQHEDIRRILMAGGDEMNIFPRQFK